MANFASHSDTLKRLKAKIERSRDAASPFGMPISPQQPGLLPRRMGPGGGATNTVSALHPKRSASHCSSHYSRSTPFTHRTLGHNVHHTHPTQRGTSPPYASVPSTASFPSSHMTSTRSASPSPTQSQVLQEELREACSLITSLKLEVQLIETSKQELCEQHAKEVGVLVAQLQEAEDSAKKVLTLREEHHAQEKAQMLEVYNELQERLRKEASAHTATTVSYEQTAQCYKELEQDRDNLRGDIHKTRDALRHERFKYALDGNQEYESLVRRLEVAEEEVRRAGAARQQEVQHSKALTARLDELATVHQSTTDELNVLQEEYKSTTASQQKTIQALQGARGLAKEGIGLDAKQYKHLLAKVKEADAVETKLQCEVSVLKDELVYVQGAKDDSDEVIGSLKDEIDRLKATMHTMESEWGELLRARDEGASLGQQLARARGEITSLQLARDEALRMVGNLRADHTGTSNELRIAHQQVQELELVNGEYASAFREMAAAVPGLPEGAAEAARVVVDMCKSSALLTDDLQQLRREHLDITLTLDTFQTQLTGDKRKAAEAERNLRAEQEAHLTLQEEVLQTKVHVEQYERKMQELELLVTDSVRERDTAERVKDEVQNEIMRLTNYAKEVEAEAEGKVREANTSKKKILAKVAELRDEERWYNERAVLDLRQAVEQNQEQQRVMALMEGELREVRKLLVEGIDAAATQSTHNAGIQEMIEKLRDCNARCEGVYDSTVAQLERKVTDLQSEGHVLRLGAKRDADQLLHMKAEASHAQQDYATLHQVSDDELVRAATQVEDLRDQLQQSQQSRKRVQSQGSQLTAELSTARREAQSQQRVLISEINALALHAAQ